MPSVPTFGSRLGAVALSHHLPHEHDRCVVIGRRHVCRRCLVLYPIAFAVMFVTLAGYGWSRSLDPVLFMVLPFAVAVEFVAEKLGLAQYVARRQIALTALAAPALGTGLARHIRSPFDGWFVAMVLGYGGACAVAHVVASSRETRMERAERVASEEADPVLDGFGSADEFRRYLDTRAAAQS
jgi:hypothetical protein